MPENNQKNLLDLVYDHERVSIIGMCKNAGKTTVLGALINECDLAGINLALCSVGRDGELVDVVTNTEKPAISIREGTIFSTTSGLVPCCDIDMELIRSTGVSTALGEVLVFKAKGDGDIQLSGPSINAQILPLMELFKSTGARKVLIDGAVCRKASSSPDIANAVILCSGADYDSDMQKVIADTAHFANIICTKPLPSDSQKALIERHRDVDEILLFDGESLLSHHSKYERIENDLRRRANLAYFSGALTEKTIETALGGTNSAKGLKIVADNPSKIMLSLEYSDMLRLRECELFVLTRAELACICINPFCTSGNHFDKSEFFEKMQNAVDVPVINVRG